MQRSPEMFRDAQSRQMEQRNAIHYIDRCRRAINNRGLRSDWSTSTRSSTSTTFEFPSNDIPRALTPPCC